MNLSPRGRDIGYRGKAKPTEIDEASKNLIQYVRAASNMEDDTERTINDIENMRRATLDKAQSGNSQ